MVVVATALYSAMLPNRIRPAFGVDLEKFLTSLKNRSVRYLCDGLIQV